MFPIRELGLLKDSQLFLHAPLGFGIFLSAEAAASRKLFFFFQHKQENGKVLGNIIQYLPVVQHSFTVNAKHHLIAKKVEH